MGGLSDSSRSEPAFKRDEWTVGSKRGPRTGEFAAAWVGGGPGWARGACGCSVSVPGPALDDRPCPIICRNLVLIGGRRGRTAAGMCTHAMQPCIGHGTCRAILGGSQHCVLELPFFF